MNSLRSTMIRKATATIRLTGTIRQTQMKTSSTVRIPTVKTFHSDATVTTPTGRLPATLRSHHQQHHQQKHLFSSSSSPSSPASSTKDLVSLLSREHAAEQTITRGSSLSPALADLRTTVSESWTVIDGSSTGGSGNGGATTRMVRIAPLANGARITLTFHCQDTIVEEEGALDGMFDGVHNAMDAASPPAENNEEEEEISPPVRFDATVSRAGTTLHLSCISEDAAATVVGASVFTGGDADKHDGAVTEESFRGPEMEDLTEDVQEAFGLFLTEEWGCGVDTDVAAFIAMWADYREQSEYVDWLEGVKKIVE